MRGPSIVEASSTQRPRPAWPRTAWPQSGRHVAVGLVDEVSIMALAIIIAIVVMMFAAKPIGDFIDKHPTFKVLALAFLVVVGIVLILDGFDIDVPKGYIYFAIAFSMGVEVINMRLRDHKTKT